MEPPRRDDSDGWRTTLRSSRYRSFDGTEIATQACGDQGHLVVLANGLGGSLIAWRPLVAKLARDHRIVTWDYRGLYDSGPPTDPRAVGIEAHCQDLHVLVDRFGGGPAVLIGWSMGVQVAVEFALSNPHLVGGLVLVCGAPGDPFADVFHTPLSKVAVPAVCRVVEAVPGGFGAAVRYLAASGPAPALLRRMGVVASGCDLEVLREVATYFSSLDWRRYARMMRAMGHHNAWASLGEIRTPTLVIGGTRDLITPSYVTRRMATAIPNAELLFIEGATHYAPLEFPQQINAAIGRFLRDRAEWSDRNRRVSAGANACKGGHHVVEQI